MKIVKFRASAISRLEGLSRIREIVAGYRSNAVVVVVSALEGVTDDLIAMAQQAAQGNIQYQKTFLRVSQMHQSLCEAVEDDRARFDLVAAMDEKLEELSNIYKGIYLVHDLTPKTLSKVMSYGEQLSSLLVHYMLPESQWVDALEVIKTEKKQDKHVVDFALTQSLVNQKITKKTSSLYVISGFIASDRDSQEVTHLGRGGSDYSAAVIAAALGAEKLEIWTDTPGFTTADPALIPNAYTIRHLSYVEALELCNFGVKVIYPPSIYPAYHYNIPISIRNIHNLSDPGTLIEKNGSSKAASNKPVCGISSINETCLITVRGLGMVGVIGVNYRIFKALADGGVSVFLVSQTASENNTSIAVKRDVADLAVQLLNQEFQAEIAIGEISEVSLDRGLATVAIVGEQMRRLPGIAGKLYDTLGRNGINVIAAAQGASEMNISLVIREESLFKAINVIHDSFFLSDFQVLNLFISGVGLVGKNLLAQLKQQQALLQKEKKLAVRVVGISNSRKCYIDANGIELDQVFDLLEQEGKVSTPEIFAQNMIGLNLFNSVFVDCTASSDVAEIYQTLLNHNVHVVAANKIAASSPYANYVNLKATARKRGVKFLFETNVGAGLPIINTINSLINSGDKILCIEAVVSGTLNYIFNELSEQTPLSKAIQMAQEAGYAEPDPRLDLNGSDVVRKLVILAREAGYEINQEHVKKNLFIPQSYFEGSLTDFWNTVPALDPEFEDARKATLEAGKRHRFVASFDQGVASVALRAVDSKSPFYELEGSNNVILLTTERYKDYPMVIKGYGAGAAVTAAGVFADIISIANIR